MTLALVALLLPIVAAVRHAPPPWAAKVPAGVCYHRVAADGREMMLFLAAEDASEGAAPCRFGGRRRGGGGAPLVVALHGFGGGYPDMFVPLSGAVAARGLALAVPRGLNGSWNGRYCCGVALRERVDDVGALRALLAAARRLTRRVDAALAFGVGFSNGGFLASDAAALPGRGPPLFKAVVSVAGHALRVGLDARPTPVLMVHGDGDAVVPLGGCCGGNEALPICAAALEAASPFGVVGCRGARDVFRQWLRANGCAGETATRAGGRACVSGTGCAANTTLCVAAGLGHFPEFVLPGAAAQADALTFVAREACRARGGAFGDAGCACASGTGPFCWTPPD